MENKYKNINDNLDYNNIKFINDNLDEILNLDFEKENIELYFGYKYEHRGSVFQCVKSETNKSTEVISEYDEDEYVRDGNDDSEHIEEMFDETNEVHEGWSYSVWLCKINSEDFKTKIKDKLQEWSDSKDDEYFYLSEFLEWVEYDDYGVHTLEDVYEHLGGDLNDLESILDEEDIDETGNCISWYSYFQLDEEYLQIGYRKLEDK